MAMLEPRLAILDETDSGLDIDALRDRRRRRERAALPRARDARDHPLPAAARLHRAGLRARAGRTAGSCVGRQGAGARARGARATAGSRERRRGERVDAARDHYAERCGAPSRRRAGRTSRHGCAGCAREAARIRASRASRHEARRVALHERDAARPRAVRAARLRAGARSRAPRSSRVSFPVFACSVFVFVDGRFRPELSSPRALSGSLRVESLAELRASEPERAAAALGQRRRREAPALRGARAALFSTTAPASSFRAGRASSSRSTWCSSRAARRPTASATRGCWSSRSAGSRATLIQDFVSVVAERAASRTRHRAPLGAGRAARSRAAAARERGRASTSRPRGADRARRALRRPLALRSAAASCATTSSAVLEAKAPRLRARRALPRGRQRSTSTTTPSSTTRCRTATSRELYKGILGGAGARRLPRPRDRAARRAEDRRRADEHATPALRRRRDRLEAAARDLRRRREVQPRRDDRPARRGRALLPALARASPKPAARAARCGLRRRGAREPAVAGAGRRRSTELLREQMRGAGAGERARREARRRARCARTSRSCARPRAASRSCTSTAPRARRSRAR